MHLERLEIQGFKTFAKKTVLTFPAPKNNHCPITAIVGPNGSGKSNSADAIRWVLGEQSLKLLRGKQSEDVIFSGAEGKTRAGFAEVTIHLNNEDKTMPIDYQTVVITRRLYRDGTSEYLLNEHTSRLIDIQLLLAQANVGQRSYSVIGQGMVDHILIATPEERKQFFDDATGVKQFQIKRHEAVLKLTRTLENLLDAETILQEIEPHLKSLKRQASRLEKRKEIETQLHELEHGYYGSLWWQISDDIDSFKRQLVELNKIISTSKNETDRLEKKLEQIEKEETTDESLRVFQQKYRENQRKCEEIRAAQFETEKAIEMAKIKAQSSWTPLPLEKIIEGIEEVNKKLKQLKQLKQLKEILEVVKEAHIFSQKLISQLKRPNAADMKPDPKLVAKLSLLKQEETKLGDVLKRLENEIDSFAQKEQRARAELIETQRALRTKQQEQHEREQKRNQLEIELARLEERQQGLIREMDEFMSGGAGSGLQAGKDRAVWIRQKRIKPVEQSEEVYPEIQRLRYKLELIGGIDPEILKEYKDIQERFDFLETQVKDLQHAVRATEKIIQELDEKIEHQSKKLFGDINKKFEYYFKLLFGGGSCALVKLTKEKVKEAMEEKENMEVTPERAFSNTGEIERDKTEHIKQRLKQHEDQIVGVDIQATPPGKRMKALNLLSGGERALTSIALLSAIMDINPSPFVVLDEVDAALDEANTIRFAAILDELSKKSQFIIITHNRATMEKTDVLYGVTMGDDGISNLLSVHLADIAKNGSARR